MSKREAPDELRARLRRFEDAKAELEFFETGLGQYRPDATVQRDRLMRLMWDNANGPAKDDPETNEATP